MSSIYISWIIALHTGVLCVRILLGLLQHLEHIELWELAIAFGQILLLRWLLHALLQLPHQVWVVVSRIARVDDRKVLDRVVVLLLLWMLEVHWVHRLLIQQFLLQLCILHFQLVDIRLQTFHFLIHVLNQSIEFAKAIHQHVLLGAELLNLCLHVFELFAILKYWAWWAYLFSAHLFLYHFIDFSKLILFLICWETLTTVSILAGVLCVFIPSIVSRAIISWFLFRNLLWFWKLQLLLVSFSPCAFLHGTWRHHLMVYFVWLLILVVSQIQCLVCFFIILSEFFGIRVGSSEPWYSLRSYFASICVLFFVLSFLMLFSSQPLNAAFLEFQLWFSSDCIEMIRFLSFIGSDLNVEVPLLPDGSFLWRCFILLRRQWRSAFLIVLWVMLLGLRSIRWPCLIGRARPGFSRTAAWSTILFFQLFENHPLSFISSESAILPIFFLHFERVLLLCNWLHLKLLIQIFGSLPHHYNIIASILFGIFWKVII